MNNISKTIGIYCLVILLSSCETKQAQIEPTVLEPIKEVPSTAAIKKALIDNGFKIIDYIDKTSGDTILMQQYYMAFLKPVGNKILPTGKLDSLQQMHLAYLGKMYQLGYADISGPFEDSSAIAGVTIYNVPTLEMADSLASADPMVKAGQLTVEIHPWWAAKGFPLR